MNESKTVEGEIADFSGKETHKPDVAPAPVIKQNVEQFEHGKIFGMYHAFRKLDQYLMEDSQVVITADVQVLRNDFGGFLKYADLYITLRDRFDSCESDLKLATEAYQDVKNLDALIGNGSKDMVAPKALRKRVMDICNYCISRVNSAQVEDYTPTDTTFLDIANINETLTELSEDQGLVNTIILTRNLQLLFHKENNIFTHFRRNFDGVYKIPGEVFISKIKGMVDYCQGKEKISYKCSHWWQGHETSMFTEMKDLTYYPQAKIVKKHFWSRK